jgi:AraC-like DNA-binding protein
MNLRYAENPPRLDKLGIEIQPVHCVRDYLEEHADREISLEQLSQIANLSPFHLNRWHSLPEVIVQQNLWNAATRLSNSNANFAEKSIRLPPVGSANESVAIKTGFVSQSHFGSHFKRLVGVTPKQYIQNSKNVINFDV